LPAVKTLHISSVLEPLRYFLPVLWLLQ